MATEHATERFGLNETTISSVTAVFSRYAEVESAVIYGSRAKGNYREGSDIDLTLTGPQLTYRIMTRIEDEIDDLLLPYLFDLSILSHIENPNVVDHIRRVGKLFYKQNPTSTL